MVTIFTPAYNRAPLFQRLYDSLESQTCRDFEWVIVDDGSSDDTCDVVAEIKARASFPVRYFYQENGGKHRAINRGVREACGELFFIVDNDDVLVSNAIERVCYHFSAVRDDRSFAGVCGLKAFFNGDRVGGEQNFGILDCNAIDFRYKYGIKGDMAEVFRTDILKKYPFPEIDNERFCPEAVVFNRIALKYKLRYFYEKIYLCEYLPDGLTAKIVKIRMNSPIASMMCYRELCSMPVPLAVKMRAAINYWRFALCGEGSRVEYMKGMTRFLLFAPLGALLHINDKRHS